MFWHVHTFSAVDTFSGEPTVFNLSQLTGEGDEQQLLYLGPSAIYSGSDGRILLIDYYRSVSASYRGVVELSLPSGFSSPVRPSVLGYLSPIVSGDFNGDGAVNAADYTVHRDDFGFWGADYAQWASSYGVSSAASPASVPETCAGLLLALAGLGLVIHRR